MKPRTPAQVSRNSVIIVVSFFLYIIISSLIIMNIDNGELAAKPVWEAVFGRSFVVGHLGAVTGLLFLFVALFILNRTGHIELPFRYYQKEEKRIFFEKYSFNCLSGTTKSKRRFLYSIMLFSTFLPGIIVLLYWYYSDSDDISIPVIAGTVMMFILFYGSLFLLMKKDDKNIREFFVKVNRLFDDTVLELKNYGMQNSLGSSQFLISLEGIFKGRKISLGNSTAGYRSGRNVKVNSITDVVLEINSKADIRILKTSFENNKLNYRLVPIVEYSGDSERLTSVAKELIEQYDRPLHMQIQNGLLSYEAKDLDIIPFYTMEGIILFLDFMTILANEIENSPFV